MKKIFLVVLVALAGSLAIAQQRIALKTPEEKLNEEYCSGLFKSADGTVLDLMNGSAGASAYFNVLDWLQGRVAGLRVYTLRNGNRIPVIRGQQSSIFIDEVQVSSATLNALSVSDIAMIKVIRSPFLGGFNGAGGAIAIYTIRAEEEESGR